MRHQTISFIKSGVRIVGYILLGIDMATAVGFLISSEMIGIFEELGHE